MSATSRRPRRLARRTVVTAAAVLAVGSAAAAATGLGVGLPNGNGRGAEGSRLPPATATVTRQTLVDRQTEPGELGYGDTTTLTNRLTGTVTAVRAAGSTVKRGNTLYRVDNTPVVLLYGALPAYRALATGTKGADVRQLERNLRALSYSGFEVDDEYTAATASAVKEWQEDLGLPETGIVDLGRVLYANGPVRVGAAEAADGDTLQPGTAVLTYTGTSRAVSVDLDMSDARLARKGRSVKVTLPNRAQVTGRISSVETVIDDSGGEGGAGGGAGGADGSKDATTKIRVTVALAEAEALAGLDQATVDVAFTASQRKNVLTVPVAALLALAEGGYGVEVVEGTTTRIVAVETGMFADGRVEIRGDGLSEGTTVGMPA